MTRHDDDRDLSGALVGLESARGLHAIHLRHRKVHHDGVEPLLLGEPDGCLAFERDRDVIADVIQIEGIQLPAIFDVVDDQDSSRTRYGALNGIRGHVTGFEVAAGSSAENVPR